MARFPVAAVVLAALLSAGCFSSRLVLHVNADGSGTATMSTRLYLSNMRAFDSLFANEAPQRPPRIQEELPAPGDGALRSLFGTPVRLVSTRLESAPDGAIRTTDVAFDDIRQVQLAFPPVPSGTSFDMSGTLDRALITFSIRRHDNGDRLLIVKLPDPRMANATDAPITEFKTNSPEELAFKQAVKNMSLQMFVETGPPLLRTNAPRQDGNRATILDLDLDRMINAMDETRARRMVAPGSFQELLWQMGDLPGATVPVDRELFLEYQDPDAQQPPAPAARPAAPAPPDTEIYLATLTDEGGRLVVGAPVNITNNPGYDNQPFFTPDGRGILFTSQRGIAPALRDNPAAPQTDIYRYDIASRAIARVTQTPESEYSPTVMPDGERMSVIRVEADGTQRLWSVTPSGPKAQFDVLLPDVKPVGYHAWADGHTLVLFVLGAGNAPATLQIADTRTGQARVLATDIGRSILRMPGSGASRHISFVQRARAADGATTLEIKELDPASGTMTPLIAAVDGSREADLAWMPDGTLLMAKDDVLYGWRRGEAGWRVVADLKQLSLSGVSRLAVSPAGDRLALVGSPR